MKTNDPHYPCECGHERSQHPENEDGEPGVCLDADCECECFSASSDDPDDLDD